MRRLREYLAPTESPAEVALLFSEKTLHDPRGSEPSEIAEMVEEFRKRDLVYDGRLPPPKGQLPDDWEDREQVLFR